MNFTSIPIIVLCTYLVAEVYKFMFRNKKEWYELIPVISSLFGAILGLIIYYTNKELMLYADSAWTALGIGIVSGASATGANQIIKQLFKKKEEEEK